MNFFRTLAISLLIFGIAEVYAKASDSLWHQHSPLTTTTTTRATNYSRKERQLFFCDEQNEVMIFVQFVGNRWQTIWKKILGRHRGKFSKRRIIETKWRNENEKICVNFRFRRMSLSRASRAGRASRGSRASRVGGSGTLQSWRLGPNRRPNSRRYHPRLEEILQEQGLRKHERGGRLRKGKDRRVGIGSSGQRVLRNQKGHRGDIDDSNKSQETKDKEEIATVHDRRTAIREVRTFGASKFVI